MERSRRHRRRRPRQWPRPRPRAGGAQRSDGGHRDQAVRHRPTLALGLGQRRRLSTSKNSRSNSSSCSNDARASGRAGPCSPPTTGRSAALAQHHDRLSSTYRIVAPPTEVARYFLDKRADVGRRTRRRRRHCRTATDRRSRRRPRSRTCAFRSSSNRTSGTASSRASEQAVRRARSRRAAPLASRGSSDARDARARSSTSFRAPTVRSTPTAPTSTRAASHAAASTVRKLRQSPPFFGVARVAEIVRGQSGAARSDARDRRDASAFAAWRSAEFKLRPARRTFPLPRDQRSLGHLQRAACAGPASTWAGSPGRTTSCGRPERPVRMAGPGCGSTCTPTSCTRCSTAATTASRFADFLAPYRRPKIDAVWSASDPLALRHAVVAHRARRARRPFWNGTHREAFADRTRPLSDHLIGRGSADGPRRASATPPRGTCRPRHGRSRVRQRRLDDRVRSEHALELRQRARERALE